MSFFEAHHISNEYLPMIIQLFIENGYDINADNGHKAAMVLASLYYGPKHMDSYILDAARLIIREEPRVLEIIQKRNVFGGTGDDDDSYLNIDEELYRAYNLFNRICWDEDDCVVPDHMYPDQHRCTVWRKLLETCFERKDPTSIDYYNRLYGQRILDVLLPDSSPETRPERHGQYIIDGDIILICELNTAVIEKSGSLYIDDSVEYRNLFEGTVLANNSEKVAEFNSIAKNTRPDSKSIKDTSYNANITEVQDAKIKDLGVSKKAFDSFQKEYQKIGSNHSNGIAGIR